MTDDQAKLIEIATLMHKANVSDDPEDKRRFKTKASEISECQSAFMPNDSRVAQRPRNARFRVEGLQM